jgi:hypothetical protein
MLVIGWPCANPQSAKLGRWAANWHFRKIVFARMVVKWGQYAISDENSCFHNSICGNCLGITAFVA